ncbi:MAG: S8 family serine peptidase, partial [Planctomycetota bacterium]
MPQRAAKQRQVGYELTKRSSGIRPPISGRSTDVSVVVEDLEPRLLLSSDVGSLVLADVLWNGQPTQAVAGEYVLRFAHSEVKTTTIAESLWEFGYDGAEVWNLGGGEFALLQAGGADLVGLQAWAQSHTDVLYLEPNFVHQMGDITPLATTPTDSRYSQLWGLNNTGQTGGTPDADIDAAEAWDLTTGSSDVVIAIIDTGIDYTHNDLAANMWTNPGEIAGDGVDNDGNGYVDDVYGWDFYGNDSNPIDDNSHGTHVAGTIGGASDGSGVVGVNWDVKLMALKFLSGGGYGSTSGAIQAVNYATMMKRDYGVNIVATNNSWGGGGYSTALRDAIAAGGQQDILFVAAAGNDNNNNDQSASYPASYNLDEIISVAATDHRDAKASFSSYGATTVDLAAPGVSILSSTPGNGYASYSGTSMATPHVSGVVGLLAASAPGATALEIKQAILDGADPISSMTGKALTGGRLNAFNSLQLLDGSDRRGPTVDEVSPAALSGPTDEILVTFSEDLDAASVSSSSFELVSAGADRRFGTADDGAVTVTNAMVSRPADDQVQIL